MFKLTGYDEKALALAPEAMSEEQLEDAIAYQCEFLKNVSERLSGSNPLFQLPLIEQLKALDALCAQVHERSRPDLY